MIPSYGTPGGERLMAAIWAPGARTRLQSLRRALHHHRVFPELRFDEGQPHLVISPAPGGEGIPLVVWTDPAGTSFCWGPGVHQEPLGDAVTEDFPEIAQRIAELHRPGMTQMAPTPAS